MNRLKSLDKGILIALTVIIAVGCSLYSEIHWYTSLNAGNVAEVLGQAAVYSVTTGILLWACQRLRPVREQKTAFYALWVCLCAIVAGGVPLNQMSQRGWMANDQSLFMESAGASCIKKQQSVQANGSISNDKISRYCTCFARELADTISSPELMDIRNAQVPVSLQQKIATLAPKCRTESEE